MPWVKVLMSGPYLRPLLAVRRRSCARRSHNVRTWFNSESDPPPDLVLSTMSEERADSLLCVPP
jgi:hypothetical protein